MTFNDLCEDIAALGFEAYLENTDTVQRAVNRALRTIFSEHRIYSEFTAYQDVLKPCEHIEAIRHTGGKSDTVTFRAKAFSFKTSGIGAYRITDAKGTREYEFDGDATVHRGFLYESGKIDFIGDYGYTVYALSLFDDILSDREEDIPHFDAAVCYDMKLRVEGFLSFASTPYSESEKPIPGALLFGDVMKIPTSYSGKVCVLYKRAPRAVSDDHDAAIDIPAEYEHLLMLLSASYVWLDEDPDKAQYYMSLYRDGSAAAKLYSRNPTASTYLDVTGWA